VPTGDVGSVVYAPLLTKYSAACPNWCSYELVARDTMVAAENIRNRRSWSFEADGGLHRSNIRSQRHLILLRGLDGRVADRHRKNTWRLKLTPGRPARAHRKPFNKSARYIEYFAVIFAAPLRKLVYDVAFGLAVKRVLLGDALCHRSRRRATNPLQPISPELLGRPARSQKRSIAK